ncbi:MAG: hypothetical protein RMK32_00645 [Anaerolineae bacterium]|nr:hypothetical protein [Anaerolineae bacterium]
MEVVDSLRISAVYIPAVQWIRPSDDVSIAVERFPLPDGVDEKRDRVPCAP